MDMPFSVRDIVSFKLLKPNWKKKEELMEIPVGEIPLDEFRLTMNTLISDEAKTYSKDGCNWSLFDPSVNNMFFPPVAAGLIFHYSGMGKLYTYNLSTLKAALNANRCSSEKEVLATLKKRDFTAVVAVDDLQVFQITYRNGATLDVNNIAGEVVWNNNLKTFSRLQEGCTQSGLLSAIEHYAKTKELDQNYAMNMIDVLKIQPDELNLENRGMHLEDLLGI